MTDILFAHAYFLRFDPKLHAAMQPYPPLGTLVAAAVARQQGRSVSLFDAMLAEDAREFEDALQAQRPRLAVLFEDNFNYLSKMCLLRMREAALVMLAAARRRGVRALVCGADASDHPGPYLDAGAELVLHGEGDETLRELLSRGADTRRLEPEELSQIAGLAYRPRPGVGAAIVRTPKRPVLRELDGLPDPAWDLADLPRYRRLWLQRHGRFSLNLVSTRGCPFHCNWCAKPIWGQRYAMHSPARAAELAARLRDDFGAEHLWWMDDIFGLKRGWVGEFAAAMASRGGPLPFKALTRADLLVRPGEAAAFAAAGADSIWIGAESGSQQVLDAMDKGTRIDQIDEATRLLHERGVQVGYFLQFGYPGETRADIAATLQMLRRNAPDDIGISVSYPLPGTRFFDRVADQLGAKRQWLDSSDLDMMYNGPFSTAFYRQLYRVVHKDYKPRRTARQVMSALQGRGSPPPLRALGRAAIDAATLPAERLWLERLARTAHLGITPTGATMAPEEAAVPSGGG